MASESVGLLEPTLRRTSFQDRKCELQTGARRSSIDTGVNGLQLKTALSTMLTALRNGASRYCDMVVKDPDLTSKLESAFRLTSYILPGALQLEITCRRGSFIFVLTFAIAGRLGGSWVLSEVGKFHITYI